MSSCLQFALFQRLDARTTSGFPITLLCAQIQKGKYDTPTSEQLLRTDEENFSTGDTSQCQLDAWIPVGSPVLWHFQLPD
jgi:hypothetical protein